MAVWAYGYRRNLRCHIFFQPHNQKSIHSGTMNLFYNYSPTSVLKSNAILRTDVIADLPPAKCVSAYNAKLAKTYVQSQRSPHFRASRVPRRAPGQEPPTSKPTWTPTVKRVLTTPKAQEPREKMAFSPMTTHAVKSHSLRSSALPTPPPWPGTPADEDPHNHTDTEGEEEPHGSSDENQLDRSDTESEDFHQEPDENATETTAPPALTSPSGVGLHASTIQADTPLDRSGPGDDDGAPDNDTDAPRHRRLSPQDIVECPVATSEARTAGDVRR